MLPEKVTNHSSGSKDEKRLKQNWDENKNESEPSAKWIITKSKRDSKEIGRSRINLLSTCHLEIVRG